MIVQCIGIIIQNNLQKRHQILSEVLFSPNCQCTQMIAYTKFVSPTVTIVVRVGLQLVFSVRGSFIMKTSMTIRTNVSVGFHRSIFITFSVFGV